MPSGLAKSSAAIIGAAAASMALRYRHDLLEADARIAKIERRAVDTAFGPFEYSDRGDGPPILLVHGVVGGCDVPLSWRALVLDGYRIITPSRFGYLGSPLPAEPSVSAQVDAYVTLLDALHIERMPVLAFSAGSSSAVLFALRHPERVSGLILVAANSPHEKPVTLAPRVLAPVIFSQPVMWFLRAFLPRKLARIAGVPPGYELTDADRRTLETIFDSFFPMRLRFAGTVFDGYVGNPEIAAYPVEEITVPTLGVHAGDDPLASYEDARALVERIPGFRWVRVDSGGHIFVHKDHAALAEIARFLERTNEPIEPRRRPTRAPAPVRT